MSEFMGSIDNSDKRKLFVQQRLREGWKGQMSYEDQIRIASNIATRAVMDFNKNLFAEDFLEQFEAGELPETLMTLRLNILYSGVNQIKERCRVKHEVPKSCECEEICKVIMGEVDAVSPMPTMLIDEIGEPNE